MNYGELRAHFRDILNRDDCTDALADLFIAQGVRRATRKLRIPLMKKTATILVDNTFDGTWAFPSDYLGLVSVTVDGLPINRIIPGQEYGFRVGTTGITAFDPEVREDQEIEIVYYSSFTIPTDSTVPDFEEIDDVMLYAALVYATSYFVDERKEAFEGDFQTLAGEVQMDADVDALSGGVVMTPYGGGIA